LADNLDCDAENKTLCKKGEPLINTFGKNFQLLEKQKMKDFV
jgi:hypothetical protein